MPIPGAGRGVLFTGRAAGTRESKGTGSSVENSCDQMVAELLREKALKSFSTCT